MLLNIGRRSIGIIHEMNNSRLILLRITCQELPSLLYSVIVFLSLDGSADTFQGTFSCGHGKYEIAV